MRISALRSVERQFSGRTTITGQWACLAPPDLGRVRGRVPDHPAEWWERIAEAAAASGMAAEVSSAGWRKPVAEQYPSDGLLTRLAARGVPSTTASDAHRLEDVADRASDLSALLAAAGVTRLTGFRRRQAHTVALESPGAGAPGAGAPGAGAPVADGEVGGASEETRR